MPTRAASKLIAFALLVFAGPTYGGTLDVLQNLSQEEFRLLAEDIGGAFSYHPQLPTEPLGVTGFDFGVSLTATRDLNREILDKASSAKLPDSLPTVTLRLDKGLPYGLDVGAMYGKVPTTDVDLWGAQARWAVLQGGVAEPAVGIRASYAQLRGLNQLDLTTKGLDVSISKGFAFVTPYAGVGRVWVTADPHAGALQKENPSLNRFFIGGGIKAALLNLNAEVERVGPATSLSLKAGVRF